MASVTARFCQGFVVMPIGVDPTAGPSRSQASIGQWHPDPTATFMMHRPSAVFFDVDGVLIDSLSQHLRICRDKALEYGLANVIVPDAAEFRRLVHSGTRVSPMLNFFVAVGFPSSAAELGVRDYEREFMERYRPAPFAGIGPMLERLRHAGITLGLVTSNTRANVDPALGPALDWFDPSCRFYFEADTPPRSKSWCLREGARVLGLRPAQCTYVGDQPADALAAAEAGMPFLGVTFGWGLVAGEPGVDLVDSVDGIADALLLTAA
jgi:phosphoglycolate phosphatase